MILEKYADYGFKELQDWNVLLSISPLKDKGTPARPANFNPLTGARPVEVMTKQPRSDLPV